LGNTLFTLKKCWVVLTQFCVKYGQTQTLGVYKKRIYIKNIKFQMPKTFIYLFQGDLQKKKKRRYWNDIWV